MSLLRQRAQSTVVLAAGAVLAASLTAMSSPASAQVQEPGATAASASRTAVTAGARAGESAGRKAGAAAGAAAGRKAGQRAGGAKGATAGAAAGRKAGAAAGAKAGKRAGTRLSAAAAKNAGARAGRKAGARAGAVAGRSAAAGPQCGTVTYYKPDGTPYRCVFGDDFSGTVLDGSKWRTMTSAEFNFGTRKDCFMDTSKNVYVADGVLNLVSRREAATFACKSGNKGSFRTQYTSGLVSTYQRYTQTYGRFEFRARFPHTTVNGVQSSLWLWPQGATGASWPISGEIDVAEWYSQWDDRVIPYLHYGSLTTAKATNNNCLVDRVQDWHTYVLEWQPKSIRISYDGDLCLELTGVGSPFDKPYMISMFQAMGVRKNAPTAATPGYNRAQFAWVRAWS